MSSTPPPPPPPPPPPDGGYGGGYGAAQPALPNPLVNYWKRAVLENYANFEGRARRAELWWFVLANFLIGLVFNVLIAIASIFWVLYIIFELAILIPGIAVGIRRLHDTDKSGWWLLIGLIPLVGAIVLIVFFATDGTRAPNQWGPSPKYSAA
jgi:uncharacterized membrane protein YhaH (DUF805 family)